MLLGVIADDFTGGNDIAGFLVENGMRTIQLSGPPSSDAPIDTDVLCVSGHCRLFHTLSRVIRRSLSNSATVPFYWPTTALL